MNGRPKKKRLRALQAAADFFDIPAEIAAGDSRLTLTGGRRLVIENHRGILEYTSRLIRVDCGAFTVSVAGEGLELGAMNARDMAVVGDIRRLLLGEGEEE